MVTGGLLPFPRTGCVLYAKAIVSYGSEVRQVRPRDGLARQTDSTTGAGFRRLRHPKSSVATTIAPARAVNSFAVA
jgi:hypothetical protein